MSKFTKGEWVVCDDGINSEVKNVIKMPSSKPTKYNGTMYACIGGFECETQSDEAAANAHLIAAAPDMYSMIESLAKELQGAIYEVNTNRLLKVTSQTENQPDMWDMQSLQEAQELLSKARGE